MAQVVAKTVPLRIETEFLFTIALEVHVLDLGDTPYGGRRVGHFGTGRFEGPKLKGTVLPGGAAWMLMRRDNVLEIDVRLTLETDDKQHISMTWKGFRHGPKEVIDRLNRGETVDPATYYFRTTPYFETSSDKYGWMNRICSIATGARTASERTFHVFQVLQGCELVINLKTAKALGLTIPPSLLQRADQVIEQAMGFPGTLDPR